MPVHMCDHTHDMHRCVAAHTTPRPPPHPSYPTTLFFFLFFYSCMLDVIAYRHDSDLVYAAVH